MTSLHNATGLPVRSFKIPRWTAYDLLPAELKHALQGAIFDISPAQVYEAYRKHGVYATLAWLRLGEAEFAMQIDSETWAKRWSGDCEPLQPNWAAPVPAPAEKPTQTPRVKTTQDLGL